MSLFEDFSDFLEREEIEKQQQASAKTKKLRATREEYDALMRQVFAKVQDYYQTILTPRLDLFLVFKKDTDIKNDNDTYFLYRINIIAQDSVPLGLDLRYATTPYLIPEKVTPDDWHANVALQVTVFFKRNTEDTLSLVFTCQIWGILKSTTPLTKEIIIHTAEKRHLPVTTLTTKATGPRDTTFLRCVEEILTMATTNVLTHREIVWRQ